MANKTPAEYLAEPYGRLLVREPEGGFSAEILEFPGCIAEGETAEETVANLERAATAWIESELEQNHEIPPPSSGDHYNGRLLVRLPRSLHRGLALKAKTDKTSINQQAVTAIAWWLGAADVFRYFTERAESAWGTLAARVVGWPNRSFTPKRVVNILTSPATGTVSGTTGKVLILGDVIWPGSEHNRVLDEEGSSLGRG